MNALEGLNPQQKEAASHLDGPMLVLAGPGTGKTKTLAARFAYMLERGVPIESILALTFARKASQDMRARMAEAANLRNPSSINAGTFHSMASVISKIIPEAFPRLHERKLMDDTDTTRLAREIAMELPCDEQDAAERISGYKDRLLDPTAAMDLAKRSGKADEIAYARTYERYEAKMLALKAYDFGDLVMGVVEGITQHPELSMTLSQRWPYLLIDEYQDLNPAQHALARLLLGKNDNLWAVGDDDQAIYAWRNADLRQILEFSRFHGGAKLVRLVQNYRSTPEVLEIANTLIRHNTKRYEKDLIPTRSSGPMPHIFAASTPDMEAKWVQEQISALLQQGIKPQDIAILSRGNAHLAPIERALSKARLPKRSYGTGFWGQKEVRQVLAAILNRIQEPLFPGLDPAPSWMLKRIEDRQRGRDFLNVSTTACTLFEDQVPKRLNEERKAAWRFNMVQLLTEIQDAGSIEQIKARFREGRTQNSQEEGINLMTIHASKGLEWPAVFVIGWEEGALPHSLNANLDEERRLAYVAITRAKKFLYLSRSQERLRKAQKPSRFLLELQGQKTGLLQRLRS